MAPRLRAVVSMKVEDIMTKTVRAIGTTASLEDAHSLMRETGIHHLVVMKAGHVAGILSSHDCDHARATHFVSHGDKWTVEQMMTTRVIVAAPETTIEEAAAMLRGHAIGCLPVLDGKTLVGIITISDLLDLLAEKPPRSARKVATEGEVDNPVRIRS